jgi:hypothetical protein
LVCHIEVLKYSIGPTDASPDVQFGIFDAKSARFVTKTGGLDALGAGFVKEIAECVSKSTELLSTDETLAVTSSGSGFLRSF